MGRGRRDVYLNPQEFNKQLPGMKRDASVYLYNEVVRRCVRVDGREREKEEERRREENERWTRKESKRAREKEREVVAENETEAGAETKRKRKRINERSG